MKRFVSIFIVLVITAQIFTSSAQRRQGITEQDRQKWLEEMRAKKHEFLAQELNLTKEQQNEFFPIYDEMDRELNKIGAESRELEQKYADNPKASDEEIELAARTVYEQKQREGAVEARYFNKFKTILKPRQLLKLKDVERRFTHMLVKGRQGRGK